MRLGHGSHGTVYQGLWSGQQVAVKARPSSASEAGMMAQMTCPGLTLMHVSMSDVDQVKTGHHDDLPLESHLHLASLRNLGCLSAAVCRKGMD